MTDHDRLFKELLTTFFLDFIELFFPDILVYLDTSSITFLDKEVFTDVTAGDRYETDILVQARFKDKPTYFLIHVENQSSEQKAFGKRMFRYFARLYEKYDYPIYPIVVFSYDKPRKRAPNKFQIDLPGFIVATFNYRVVQLNQLNWRDFLDRPNPVASALMSKMRIDRKDRPKVKAQCLRLLVTLKLDPARMYLISGFVDTYLRLNAQEKRQFEEEIGNIEPEAKEAAMQIVTSWMEEGIVQGRQEGLQQGRQEGLQQGLERETNLLVRQLQRRFNPLPEFLLPVIRQLEIKQLETLGEAFLDFESVQELVCWLLLTPPVKQRNARVLQLLEGHLGQLPEEMKAQLLGLKRGELKKLGRSLLGFEKPENLTAWLAQSASH